VRCVLRYDGRRLGYVGYELEGMGGLRCLGLRFEVKGEGVQSCLQPS